MTNIPAHVQLPNCATKMFVNLSRHTFGSIEWSFELFLALMHDLHPNLSGLNAFGALNSEQ